MAEEFNDGQEWGRSLLMRLGDGATPEVFKILCGVKARSFTIGAATVDTTVPSCTNPGGKVVATSRPGQQTVSFEASGKFVKGADTKRFQGYVRDNKPFNAEVVVPGDGTYTAQWMVSNFQYTGDETNTLEFSATFNTVTDYEFEEEVIVP